MITFPFATALTGSPILTLPLFDTASIVTNLVSDPSVPIRKDKSY